MVIGRADGPLSANVHASIPGIVRDIRVTALPEGGQAEAVVIALEGSFDRLGRREERYLWSSMGCNEILATIRDKGVVDTEEPGLPLFDILSEKKDIELLFVNAIESEPYLKAEACLLRDKGEEVMDGVAILRKVLSPKRTILASSGERPENLPLAREGAPAEEAEIEYFDLEPIYPQDMPRQLLEAVSGQKQGDALFIRPSTAYAVHEAVVHGKPMVERYVSIAGGALKRPEVLKARIGTPIGDLIEECGGFLGPPARLVLRGALRGHSVHDLDVPVTKTTSAVIALDSEEVGFLWRSPCIRCGRCAKACPERLDPDMLFRLVERGLTSRALGLGLGSCTACGACSYICPARVPLVAAFSAELRTLADAIGDGDSSGGDQGRIR
jgi:electron transport complex protein RnfC